MHTKKMRGQRRKPPKDPIDQLAAGLPSEKVESFVRTNMDPTFPSLTYPPFTKFPLEFSASEFVREVEEAMRAIRECSSKVFLPFRVELELGHAVISAPPEGASLLSMFSRMTGERIKQIKLELPRHVFSPQLTVLLELRERYLEEVDQDLNYLVNRHRKIFIDRHRDNKFSSSDLDWLKISCVKLNSLFRFCAERSAAIYDDNVSFRRIARENRNSLFRCASHLITKAPSFAMARFSIRWRTTVLREFSNSYKLIDGARKRFGKILKGNFSPRTYAGHAAFLHHDFRGFSLDLFVFVTEDPLYYFIEKVADIIKARWEADPKNFDLTCEEVAVLSTRVPGVYEHVLGQLVSATTMDFYSRVEKPEGGLRYWPARPPDGTPSTRMRGSGRGSLVPTRPKNPSSSFAYDATADDREAAEHLKNIKWDQKVEKTTLARSAQAKKIAAKRKLNKTTKIRD